MTAVRVLVLLVALLIAGCSSNTAWRVSTGTPNPGAQVHVSSSGDLAALFGLAILAGGVYAAGTTTDLSYTRHPPEMAPDRRISEQDCTKPIDYSLGNIRCK